MKAPKEIYLPLVDWGENGEIMPGPVWWEESDVSREKENINGTVKYLRADLAELTWEDIRTICEIESDLWEEVCQGEKDDSMQPYYTEVLRRFLESKKKV